MVGTSKYRRLPPPEATLKENSTCESPAAYSLAMRIAAPEPHAAVLPGRVKNLVMTAERSLLLHLQSLAARLHRTPARPRHLLTGERGELEALFYLRRLGYLFVERRWRSPELNGDIDLIGWDGPTLCFVEVKARTARDLAPAHSAVDDQKKRMLRRMARAYRRTLPRAGRSAISVRFDVISVYLLPSDPAALPDCELIRNAFPLLEEPGSRYFA